MPLPAPSMASDQTAAIQAYFNTLGPGATVVWQSGGLYRVDYELFSPLGVSHTVSSIPTRATLKRLPLYLSAATSIGTGFDTFTVGVVTDSTKTWAVDELTGRGITFHITSGPAAGDQYDVRTNTATVVTLDAPFSPTPLVGNTYQVWDTDHNVLYSGTLTAVATTSVSDTVGTLTDTNQNWTPNQFVITRVLGDAVQFIDGPNQGNVYRIIANTATQITVHRPFHVTPAVGNTYQVLQDGTWTDPTNGKVGTRNLSFIVFNDCNDIDVGYLEVQGTNQLYTYSSTFEGAHPFQIKHCKRMRVHDCWMEKVWGDSCYISGNDGYATDEDWSQDIQVDHNTMINIGRQGMSPLGILRGNLHHNTFINIRRSGHDIEPPSSAIGGGCRDTDISDNTFEGVANAWIGQGNLFGVVDGVRMYRNTSTTLQPDIEFRGSTTVRRKNLIIEGNRTSPSVIGPGIGFVGIDGIRWANNALHYQNSKGSTSTDLPVIRFTNCTNVEYVAETYDELVHSTRMPSFASGVIQIDRNHDTGLDVYAPPNFFARWTKAGPDNLPPADCGVYVAAGNVLTALPGATITITPTNLISGVPTVIAEAGSTVQGYAPFAARTSLFGTVTITGGGVSPTTTKTHTTNATLLKSSTKSHTANAVVITPVAPRVAGYLEFNPALNQRITTAVAGLGLSDWTMLWVGQLDSTLTSCQFIQTTTQSGVEDFSFRQNARNFRGSHFYKPGTTALTQSGDNAMDLANSWTFLASVFTVSDQTIKLFKGYAGGAVAQISVFSGGTPIAGVGTFSADSVSAIIGNNSSDGRRLDGRVAMASLIPSQLTLAQLTTLWNSGAGGSLGQWKSNATFIGTAASTGFTDLSSAARTMTVTGGPVWTVDASAPLFFVATTWNLLHSTDMVLVAKPLRPHTTDSVLRAQRTPSHGATAVLLKTRTLTHTTGVVIKRDGIRAHTAEALVVVGRGYGSGAYGAGPYSGLSIVTTAHLATAYVQRTSTTAHTAGAVVKLSSTRSHTADAVVRASRTRAVTTDAVLRASRTTAHLADVAVARRSTKTHLADATLRLLSTVIHSADAHVVARPTRAHTTAAVLRRSSTRLHTTLAVVASRSTRPHTADTVVKLLGLRPYTADAYLTLPLYKTHDTDAIIGIHPLLSHTTSTVVARRSTKAHSTFATVLLSTLLTHDADATLRKTNTTAHATTAVARATRSRAVSTDAVLLARRVPTHNADAHVVARTIQNRTFDAVLLATSLRAHGATTHLVARRTRTHTTTAVVSLSSTRAYTTGAVLAAQPRLPMSTDAVLLATQIRSHGAIAFVQQTTTLEHTTDVNIAFLARHQADAVLIKLETKRSHTTTAIISWRRGHGRPGHGWPKKRTTKIEWTPPADGMPE